ncbi:MAG: hypothetical protein IKB09_12550 [Oscillospiraceae bacterium]|nr:hypothetical protein [Oscillospiraceae bacterium]
MTDKCFVIMPYGQTDAAKKEYGRVYNFLIKSAVEDMGLKCIRSDMEGKGGHILGNVIEDLANAKIVIADISSLNWNVAYELGMRHVFHKNGTILICSTADREVLPFDIRSLNIFFYPTDWIDSYEELRDQLKKAIEGRLSGRTQNDSPVHEKFPYLPETIVDGFAEKTDEQLRAAKARVAQLEKELAETHQRIDAMGLSLNTEANDEAIDYSQMFLAELSNSIYNSDTAVAKLRELIENEDKKEFLEFLGKVLSVGFLDETDCRSVYALCRKLNVPAISRMYLEAVTKFYPENEDLSGFLANEYSKNYHTGEKAIQMVNGIIGVSKKDGKYVLSKTTRITRGKLGSFFDVYLHLNKYQELIEIGRMLAERFKDNPKILPVVLRNMTNAYLRLDDLEGARIYKEQLEIVEPSNDITHWICARYEDAVENYPKVVEETETCIRIDNEDVDYYFQMAAYICNNLYARDPDTMEIRKVAPKETDQFAVPFLITAISIERGAISRAIDFLRRNKFGAYIEPIIDAYQRNMSNFRLALPELNYDAVDYCFTGLD